MTIRPLGLRSKFLVGSIAIILMIGTGTISIIRPVLRGQLEKVLVRNGLLLASHVASHSISPMLTERYFDLDLMARDLQKDAAGDIHYLYYRDHHGTVVSHTFPNGFPVDLQNANPLHPGQPFSLRRLLLGDKEVIDIAYPILKGEIGVVHVGYSRQAAAKSVGKIVRLVTMILVAVLLMVVVLAALFDAWVVRPLRDLTRAVTSAGRGNLDQRVPVRSEDELGQLARSFNEALTIRQKAETDREAVITQLNESLAQVKQLSGMLPICSSCKQIRDDKGYWSQIESYISQHSEAEFSHGLCPDCAKKLYPQYTDNT